MPKESHRFAGAHLLVAVLAPFAAGPIKSLFNTSIVA
jgi:hypothetical protein